MSAYLNRLIQRFSPPASDDGSVALRPFVRSRSPIAAIDQRLGIDESLGHGLGSLGGGFDEPTAESPEPERIQRKAAGSTATAPMLAAPSPAPMTSAANLSAPAPASVSAAVEREHFGEAPRPAAARVEQAAAPTELGPRREPMDPGPLFAPYALHFELEPGPTRVEQRTIEQRTIEQRTSERIIERPVHVSTPRSPSEIATTAAARASSSAATALVQPGARVVAPPWVAFDRGAPLEPQIHERPAVIEPRSAPSTEARVIPLVIEPRQPTPAPFVPAAAPVRTVEPPTPRQAPAARERAEPSKPAAARPSPAPRSPARGKLDIESISQIGPLARHFPNRRRFRLRYR